MKGSVGNARRRKAGVGIVAVCFFLGVSGCSRPDEADTYYPLAAGRTWSYRMVLHQGNEADARSTQTSSKVTNLPPQRFEGSTVTPQQSEVSGQQSNRLIAAVNDGIAEMATQPDLQASPIPRRPPNYVLKLPLKMGESWQATWQSNQFGHTTPITMTKTVALNDGKISVPAGEFDGLLLLRIDGHGPVSGPGGPVDVRVVGEEWFKRKIGLIRGSFREEVRGYPDNASGVDLDLTEYQH
jgi:hypothetical protein